MSRRAFPNLAAYMKANPDMSGAQLAREMACSPAYISMIRWGLRQPALALALRLSAFCNIPLESLIRHQKAS